MSLATPLRTIKSFVIRKGRMTLAQKESREILAKHYCLKITDSEAWNSLTSLYSKIILEIGFGMGDALLYYARNHPDTLYLGIDVHPPGIGRLLRLAHADNLQNIRVIEGDALVILKDFIPDNCLDGVHLFFPDPWPKLRHHKRRIVNTEFADLVAKKLKIRGELHLATDWQDYAKHMKSVLTVHPVFKKISATRGERPLTKFEQRGIALGHSIFDFQFQKAQEKIAV